MDTRSYMLTGTSRGYGFVLEVSARDVYSMNAKRLAVLTLIDNDDSIANKFERMYPPEHTLRQIKIDMLRIAREPTFSL